MGALHRVIRVQCRDHAIRAALEDDFHHFRVLLEHDGTRVTRVETQGLRVPYSLCGRAGNEMASLVGAPICNDMAATLSHTDARTQCTHQLDLAAIAIAAAARGSIILRYDVIVDDPVEGLQRAVLMRNDHVVLDWMVGRRGIESPEPYALQDLGRGFTRWVTDTLQPEQAEAALVLRRGVFISAGRSIAVDNASVWRARPSGACWVQQPERARDAISNVPFRIDFSERPERLTEGDDAWLLADRPLMPPPA